MPEPMREAMPEPMPEPIGGPGTREPMALAVAQPSCRAYDVAANADQHAAAVRTAAARVVVFPELSLTGYQLDAPALRLDDPRLAAIVEACAETGTLALAGAPLPGEAGREHLAMLAIDGTGVTVAYCKVSLDGAESRFAPGEPAMLVVDGWRLGLGICRDTGIAQHAADTAALGIDAYVAGVLMHSDEAQVQDARGRRMATELGVPVAFASFAGATGGGYTSTAGRSAIWAPNAAVLAQAGPDPGDLARATLA
jgi:predicted amidohydrolase